MGGWVLEVGSGNWFSREVRGQPNALRETICAMRKLRGIVAGVSLYSGSARAGGWLRTYLSLAYHPPWLL